ncbi:hypothetical protein [Brevibacillus laterosporus]|uniref:Uncharacterized protein n=1 Tax=Brevibacillus laterosporus TaxID=1465 RepID=A0AAP3DIE9_BRELA|nr:hypothetical protein [Brevibacillus laterosporus]MCR8981636.1 hypothetical protein [Brevibacillus laterosporus]MCZ0808791.1 hypothetical protein [Brevibacillus laterosporus]MCZ0827236.1 hypothetical protein [Brevibacillus laterosporus]MCZ0850992.1 hypothetical protein [Brevibacillus laterosporus]
MIRFTEKCGDLELVYEGNTVQDVVELKKALDPKAVHGSSTTVCDEGLQQLVNKPESIGFKPE